MTQMNTDKEKEMLQKEKTEKIIEAFYAVYNILGYGFLEKVYENALAITLRKMGLSVTQQEVIDVYFEGEIVGKFAADLTVDQSVIIELKAAEKMHKRYSAQLLNYLKATDKEVGLVLNFGKEPEFVRKIMTNDRKPYLNK